MMNMNRKKGLLLLTGLEGFLLALFCMLFLNGQMNLKAFIAAVLATSIVASSIVIILIKKYNG